MTKREHWQVGSERLSYGRGVYAVAFAERLSLDAVAVIEKPPSGLPRAVRILCEVGQFPITHRGRLRPVKAGRLYSRPPPCVHPRVARPASSRSPPASWRRRATAPTPRRSRHFRHPAGGVVDRRRGAVLDGWRGTRTVRSSANYRAAGQGGSPPRPAGYDAHPSASVIAFSDRRVPQSRWIPDTG